MAQRDQRRKTPRMATLAMEVLAESREEAKDLVYYDALKRVTVSTKVKRLSGDSDRKGSNVEDDLSPLGIPVILPSPPLWKSLSRHTLALILKASRFSIDPEGTLYYSWAGFTTLAVFYNLLFIILRIAFTEVRHEQIFCWILWPADLITDIAYLIDIGIQLKRAYRDDHGIMINDSRKMAMNYCITTVFIGDVLSIVPSETIGYLLTGEHSPVFRMPRLFKLHFLLEFFEISDLRTSKPNRLRAFKLILYLGIAMHWVACVYYMISEYEGLGSNSWVYPKPTGRDGKLSRKYIKSLYWSVLTLTTIGETPEPITNLEHLFTGFMFLLGIFVFAAVVGNVGDVISNMNAARIDFQTKMDYIKWFMEHHDVPVPVQERTKRWAYYAWSRSHALHEGDAMALLPQRLRAEIAIHVHLATLKKVKIFKDCDEGLLCELVLKLRQQIFSPGDYICRCREIGREMYIINRGKVEVIVPDATTGEQVVVASLSEGNYFGEISLLRLDGGRNRRSADVRSVGYSELLCLSQRDLMEALEEYPEAKTVLESQGRDRLQRTKSEALKIPLKTVRDKKDEQQFNLVREIKELRETLNALQVVANTKNPSVLSEKLDMLQERINKLSTSTNTESNKVTPTTNHRQSQGNHKESSHLLCKSSTNQQLNGKDSSSCENNAPNVNTVSQSPSSNEVLRGSPNQSKTEADLHGNPSQSKIACRSDQSCSELQSRDIFSNKSNVQESRCGFSSQSHVSAESRDLTYSQSNLHEESRDISSNQSNTSKSSQAMNSYGKLLQRIIKAAKDAAVNRQNDPKTQPDNAKRNKCELSRDNAPLKSQDNCLMRPLTRRSKSLLSTAVCLTPKITLHNDIDGECCILPARRYSITLPIDTKDVA